MNKKNIIPIAKIADYAQFLQNWLNDEVIEKANKKGVIIGISGGIDSALVAAIAKKTFGKNMLSVSMMIDDWHEDEIDIKSLVKKLDLPFKEVNLKITYQNLINLLNINDKLALANIKPRLRMTTLYALAQELDYLVLGTDNLNEWYLGYFTKFGDGGVDLLPISHLNKSEVRQMAQFYGVPETIINKTPSAGLWSNQSDEVEMGITYQQIDQYLNTGEASVNVKQRIEHLHKISAHKRKLAPRPKIFIERYIYKKGEN